MKMRQIRVLKKASKTVEQNASDTSNKIEKIASKTN